MDTHRHLLPGRTGDLAITVENQFRSRHAAPPRHRHRPAETSANAWRRAMEINRFDARREELFPELADSAGRKKP